MISPQPAERPTLLKTTKRLLGTILVEGGFIASHNLDAAIERQKATNDQLGEILVGMGFLHPIELKAVLAIQKDLASPETAVKIGAGVRMLLGELLLKARRITTSQLDTALREQQRTGEKLGEVLVRQGLLLEYELHTVLSFQANQQNRTAGWEKLRLGELLVATGQITREQLEDVLERQKLSKKKIGELLVEAGYLKPEQIDHSLRIQQKLVTAALIAALSMMNLIGAVPEAHAGGSVMSAKITISAQVLEHTSMNLVSQAQELTVTNADIQRGFINIPAASRISVKSNNPAGYLLTFEVMSGPLPLFASVQVNVGGREVQLSPSGGWVPLPYVRGGAVLDVSYRFMLSKHAQPGTYTWPLIASVNPM